MKEYYRCSEPNCFYGVLVKSERDKKHRCPFVGPTKIGESITMTLLEQLWISLDRVVDEIKDRSLAGDALVSAKGRARGLAEALAIFSPPFFRTADEISRESLNRYNARKSNNEDYCTPGLGKLRYAFPGDSKYETSKYEKRTQGKTEEKLTQEQAKRVDAFTTAGFSPEEIASGLKVKASAVRAYLGTK